MMTMTDTSREAVEQFLKLFDQRLNHSPREATQVTNQSRKLIRALLAERDALQAMVAAWKEQAEVICQIEIDRGDKNSMPAYASGAKACRDAILAQLTKECEE